MPASWTFRRVISCSCCSRYTPDNSDSPVNSLPSDEDMTGIAVNLRNSSSMEEDVRERGPFQLLEVDFRDPVEIAEQDGNDAELMGDNLTTEMASLDRMQDDIDSRWEDIERQQDVILERWEDFYERIDDDFPVFGRLKADFFRRIRSIDFYAPLFQQMVGLENDFYRLWLDHPEQAGCNPPQTDYNSLEAVYRPPQRDIDRMLESARQLIEEIDRRQAVSDEFHRRMDSIETEIIRVETNFDDQINEVYCLIDNIEEDFRLQTIGINPALEGSNSGLSDIDQQLTNFDELLVDIRRLLRDVDRLASDFH
ncbi:hypothetical protein JTE90_005848 [Oedothorax gibbosus]|uniref:Uncharacterized protein n=1 Tax=Oedothorax gibbosus TaxID=931172 RepID=A0AAV6V203_9ARAC|nr:hypothetical protein JTE90_005848 [Oedothorax gibbosus]